MSRRVGWSTSAGVGLWWRVVLQEGVFSCELAGESANERVCELTSESVNGRMDKRAGELAVLHSGWREGGREAGW